MTPTQIILKQQRAERLERLAASAERARQIKKQSAVKIIPTYPFDPKSLSSKTGTVRRGPPVYIKIMQAVACEYGITVHDILKKDNHAEFSLPRQIAMYLVRHYYDLSNPTIARWFKRDNATILHALSKIRQMCDDSSEFKSKIMALIPDGAAS